MQGFEEHEHETSGEEEMREDGDDLAGRWIIVEAGYQQTYVRTNQSNLHIHLDDPAVIEDPQAGEQEQRDAHEDYEQSRGGPGDCRGCRLDGRGQGRNGSLGGHRGGRDVALLGFFVHDPADPTHALHVGVLVV